MNSSKSVAKSSPRRVILAGAVAAALVGIMQPAARAALLVHEFGFAGMTIGLGGSANVPQLRLGHSADCAGRDTSPTPWRAELIGTTSH